MISFIVLVLASLSYMRSLNSFNSNLRTHHLRNSHTLSYPSHDNDYDTWFNMSYEGEDEDEDILQAPEPPKVSKAWKRVLFYQNLGTLLPPLFLQTPLLLLLLQRGSKAELRLPDTPLYVIYDYENLVKENDGNKFSVSDDEYERFLFSASKLRKYNKQCTFIHVNLRFALAASGGKRKDVLKERRHDMNVVAYATTTLYKLAGVLAYMTNKMRNKDRLSTWERIKAKKLHKSYVDAAKKYDKYIVENELCAYLRFNNMINDVNFDKKIEMINSWKAPNAPTFTSTHFHATFNKESFDLWKKIIKNTATDHEIKTFIPPELLRGHYLRTKSFSPSQSSSTTFEMVQLGSQPSGEAHVYALNPNSSNKASFIPNQPNVTFQSQNLSPQSQDFGSHSQSSSFQSQSFSPQFRSNPQLQSSSSQFQYSSPQSHFSSSQSLPNYGVQYGSKQGFTQENPKHFTRDYSIPQF